MAVVSVGTEERVEEEGAEVSLAMVSWVVEIKSGAEEHAAANSAKADQATALLVNLNTGVLSRNDPKPYWIGGCPSVTLRLLFYLWLPCSNESGLPFFHVTETPLTGPVSLASMSLDQPILEVAPPAL